LPSTGDVILLRKKSTGNTLGIKKTPPLSLQNLPESFSISRFKESNRTIILIEGYDDRGILFGIRKLIRKLKYKAGSLSPSQLGYRNTANSYDG
jgi:alpha-glucuronidase